MQTVDLFDTVTMQTGGAMGIEVKTDCPHIPNDSRNIAFRAAKEFFSRAGIPESVRIFIKKAIPTGAGLGGGSADGAAVLLGLNDIYGKPLTLPALCEAGLACGADLPFCILGGTRLAQGLGEILTPLPPFPDCFILLAKPELSLSTKTVFESFSLKKQERHPNTDGIIEALEKQDLYEISIRAYNVLEEAVKGRYKDLEVFKGIMLGSGALGSSMSGSGSAVFGVFRSKREAQAAGRRFERLKVKTFITKPLSERYDHNL